MKQRIVSAMIGLVLLAVVYLFLDTLVLNLVIGLLCLMAVYELLHATGCTQFPGLVVLSAVLTLVIPFARARYVWPYLSVLLFVVIVLFFVLLLKHHATMRLEHFALAFLFSVVVPLFFSCAVYLRDDYGAALGGFYLLMALGAAWLCDTGAYFVGVACGKHKMAPHVSPKKTWEGAAGGVVVGTALLVLVAWGYARIVELTGVVLDIHYLHLLLLAPLYTVMGMLGDLSASVIKRQHDVKDFGDIMPGHGGVLDRFDSVLFTLPTVYVTARWLELASVV